MSRLAGAFARARGENRAAFIPYLTAGFPDETAFLAAARELLSFGDVLEIGLPYSDPLGDGPVIQRSSQLALASGVTPAATLDLVATLRGLTDKPLVVMSYYNPIYTYRGGERSFVRDLAEAGADGLILPDLPPEEAGELIEAARHADVDTVFLVAPTSTDERLRIVTASCRGFVYVVSVTGVTGAREGVLDEVPALVSRVKAATELPVAVGFGVSGGESAREVGRVADGVVVGSALVRRLEQGQGVSALAAEIASACVRPATRSVSHHQGR